MKYNMKMVQLSPVYWIAVGFTGAFFSFFIFLIYPSSINFSFSLNDGLAYIEVIMMILVFCSAAYFSHLAYSLEEIVQISKTKCILARLLSTAVMFLILLLFPLCFSILAAIIERVEFAFFFETVIGVLLRWSAIIFLSSCMGFLLGNICKSNFIYLASIPYVILFSHLNSIVISKFLPTDSRTYLIVTSLLSVQSPFTSAVQLDYISSFLDTFTLTKFILVILGSLTIIFLMFISSKRINKRGVFLFPLFASLLLTLTGGYAYIQLFPDSYNYKEKLYVTPQIDPSYCITSCYGNMSLSENFFASCAVQVKQNKSSRPSALQLRLDACMTIDDLTLDGKQIPFIRDGDHITVEPKDIPARSAFDIELKYHGRIYYISDISGVNILSLRKVAALPSAFAFLPVIDGEPAQISYSLTIKGHNQVISNVPAQKIGDDLYKVEGAADTLCLFMGYFDSFEIDGTTVYRAKYNKVTDYEKAYRNAFAYSYFDPYAGEQTKDTLSKRPVGFLIYDLYGILGFPVQYENYWIMNYGFPS